MPHYAQTAEAVTIVEVSGQIVSTTTNQAQISIQYPNEIIGESYRKRFMITALPTDTEFASTTITIVPNTKVCNGGYQLTSSLATTSTDLLTVTKQNQSGVAIVCSQTGTYYIVVNPTSGAFTDYLYVTPYYYNAENGTFFTTALNESEQHFTGFINQLNTRFTNVNVTGTSTVKIDVDYFLDQSEINTTIPERNPTLVRFTYGTSSTERESIAIDSTVDGVASTSYTLVGLQDGQYTLLIQFANYNTVFTGVVPFSDSYAYTEFTILGGVLVATSSIEYYNSLETLNTETKLPCGITQIDGCMINAVNYLFIPSDNSLDKIEQLSSDLKNRAPVIYVYQTKDVFDAFLNASGTESINVSASTTIGTFSFISKEQLEAIPFANYIRTILGYLLWLMVVVYIYNTSRNIFTHNNTAT